MRTRTRLLSLSAAFLAVAAAPGRADTIYLTDGSSISDCSVTSEGLLQVVYKSADKKEKELPSDKVLLIEFSRSPQLIDMAETALAEDQHLTAVDDFEEYVTGILGKPPKRYQWAPAYAMFRLVEINETMGKHDEVVKAADRLLEHAEDSRYVPYAFLKKADALGLLGKASAVTKTLDDLDALVQGRDLSKRWVLELRLARLLFDEGLKGQKRRDRLEEVAIDASAEYPTVRNRAEVAVAESYLEGKKLAAAEDIFERITKDPQADNQTLAAAYTGYGDCLFQRGVDMVGKGEDARAVFDGALKSYMRVVVVYKQELRYVPKAMFYAGRVFQQFDDEAKQERANKLYAAVMRDFRGSKWADEARGFRK